MKKIWLYIASVVMAIFLLSSCATMKKDCQGNKHYRLKNGIYL